MVKIEFYESHKPVLKQIYTFANTKVPMQTWRKKVYQSVYPFQFYDFWERFW